MLCPVCKTREIHPCFSGRCEDCWANHSTVVSMSARVPPNFGQYRKVKGKRVDPHSVDRARQSPQTDNGSGSG